MKSIEYWCLLLQDFFLNQYMDVTLLDVKMVKYANIFDVKVQLVLASVRMVSIHTHIRGRSQLSNATFS